MASRPSATLVSRLAASDDPAGRLLPVVMSLVLLFFAAGFVDETDCTMEARSSIALPVVDEAGASIDGAVATYMVDGGSVNDCSHFATAHPPIEADAER
jgi:hypothetical protein